MPVCQLVSHQSFESSSVSASDSSVFENRLKRWRDKRQPCKTPADVRNLIVSPTDVSTWLLTLIKCP